MSEFSTPLSPLGCWHNMWTAPKGCTWIIFFHNNTPREPALVQQGRYADLYDITLSQQATCKGTHTSNPSCIQYMSRKAGGTCIISCSQYIHIVVGDIENYNSIPIFDILSIWYRDIDIDIEEYISVIKKLVITEINLSNGQTLNRQSASLYWNHFKSKY